MDRLFKPSVLVQILEEFGFRFTKSLGQNFLIDGNIVRRIVDGAGVEEGSNVLEIGPGVGTLTEELLLRGANVLAVEIDKNLVDIHKKTLNYDRVKIIYDDFLRLDTEEIKSYLKGPIKVVANLPYYVTTPIITKILESDLDVESITVMVQKEVANRFAAEAGTKDYGSLSVFINYYAEPKYLFSVPKSVFMPKPNVDSAVVKLEIKKHREDIDKDKLFRVVRGAFSKRRKTILNALSTYGFKNITKTEIAEALKISGIDANRRGETLSPEEFMVLSINFPKIED